MEEVKHEKCKRCKCWRLPEDFLNETRRKLKSCLNCRNIDKIYRNNYKCEHNIIKTQCKECGGSSICEHNKRRVSCKECGGSQICEHNKEKSRCKECGGSQICEHNKFKSRCKECGGGSICEHNKRRDNCRECGGAPRCEHNKQKAYCRECKGSQICIHNIFISSCKECNPIGHLSGIVRGSVRKALKANKSKHSIEYLGCNIEEFKEHIENQFIEGMTWKNHGEWHIDHIIPLKYQNPSLEEVIKRLHWKNTQPLWAADNIAKGNRFIG
jgi:hypothetical protein